MKEISSGIYFLGLADKNRKLFDQLVPLPQGTTYNSYLIKGSEKCAIVDTMYDKLQGVYLDMISASGIKPDYIISNHAEPDHSGSIPALLNMFKDAIVLCSQKCAENLISMLNVDSSRIRIVSDGEEVALGGRTLRFIMAPWVHWPDTMFTYLVEDNYLFTCDYFGAHYTRNELFADNSAELAESAKRYYAEIMMPFRSFCAKYLKLVKDMNPAMILPSHGPVYDNPEFIINLYTDWTSDRLAKKVLMPYVSMYESTRVMVDYLENSLKSKGIEVVKADLIEMDEGDAAAELIDAACVVFGTSMVLTGPHPKSVYVSYLINILRPKLKYFSVIGSYGWGGSLSAPIDASFKLTRPEKIVGVEVKGTPTAETFVALDALADTIAEKLSAL